MPDTRTAAVALDPTALERFGVYAASVSKADLPADVIHAAKRCVIDWYATTLPGAIEAPATMLEKALADELDRGDATLMLGRKAAVRTAALINGTASHTVEFDDIYAPAIYHPGSPTIAAALAVGQARGASGDTFLRAVIAGYEVSTRIGAAMGRAHYKYWHNTGTIGPFGAAAAAGLLAGLDGRQQGHALATVATFAAGLQQAFRGDSLSKPLHAGHAADAGVLAALSAEHGLLGAPAILDAAGGMGEAMSKRAGLGSRHCRSWPHLQRQAHHREEPRLLRPCLRGHRWCDGAARHNMGLLLPTSFRSMSVAIRPPWMSRATTFTAHQRRQSSVCRSWSREVRWSMAAFGSMPTHRSVWATRPSAL